MRGLLLRVGLCCLGCCAVASAGAEQLSPEVLEKRVAVAQELAASGNVDQALAELEEIVETTRHPGIRMLTAKVSFENQRWQRSRHHFTVLANGAMGNSAEVWFSLGVIAERVDGAVETALSHYRKAVEYSPVHAEALSSLGTLLAKTHSGDQAKVAAGMALLTRAMDASPKDPVILRNHRLVRRQHVELKKRSELLTTMPHRAKTEAHEKAKYLRTPPPECAVVVPIQREPASELTLRRFYEEYAAPGKPVIITGGLPPSLRSWDVSLIEERCGDSTASVRTPKAGTWAGLEATHNVTLAAFFDELRRQLAEKAAAEDPSRQLPYLFDFSLSQCGLPPPDIPAYFSNDFLQRVPPHKVSPGSYRDYWPSVFVGQAGSASDLHVDGWCSNFWSAMIRGKKRWTIFRKSDVSRLYRNHLSGTFDVTISTMESLGAADPTQPQDRTLCLKPPHAAHYPLVSGIRVSQAEVGPGDLLFVPSRSPHWVENLMDGDDHISVALAANFVDGSNVECATKALKAMGVDNVDARALGSEMGRVDFDKAMHLDSALPWQSWDAFKGQWAAPLR